ncbi:acyl-CoA dehydrogenase [Actinomadura hibisca]|uniref:acyl-CoA dehydrogenase n=1 Tax=Actinomadura hibisca TaxID=68565 RepID=UPI001FDEC8F2|nr:acyl-CoA dehydrogenase [Actinomadura hibisca]
MSGVPMSAGQASGVPHDDLLAFVRGPVPDAKVRAQLAEAVPEEFCDRPDGLTPRERQDLIYRRLRQAGLAAPSAPELLEDPAVLCALLERAAIADPALFHVMLLHYTLALGPILRFGGGDGGPVRERADLESMRAFGTLLMTEIGRSNSHLSPRTLARYDEAAHQFVLHTPDARAAKFPTNSAHPGVPKVAAVYATLEHGGRERGVFVFVVRLRAADGSVPEGVRILPGPDTSGLPVDYAAVRLEGLRVPYEAWLRDGASLEPGGGFHDPVGDPAQRLTRSMGVAPAVWRAVISSSAAITRASAGLLLEHSRGRATLGRLAPRRPLTDYRNQREAVLGALASAYALTAVAGHVKARRTATEAAEAAASGRLDAVPGADGAPGSTSGGGPSTAWAPWSAVDRDLALLKAATTAQAQETVSLCRVHSGAPGFAATDRLNAYRGLSHAYTSAGGDNALVLFDTARAMADLDRYAPPQVAGAVPDGGDLLSPQVWPHLAAMAEARLRERLAERVRAARAAGRDAFDAWNDNLALATRTATLLADRTMLEIVASAAASAAGTGPAGLRPVLALHALGWLERRADVLLNEGVLGPGALDRVWEARRGVCDELAPRADELAAAFELPASITAPAGFVTGH